MTIEATPNATPDANAMPTRRPLSVRVVYLQTSEATPPALQHGGADRGDLALVSYRTTSW